MTAIDDLYVEFDDVDPIIVDIPDDDALEVLVIQGADGRSMQPTGQVPTYADLPTLADVDRGQVWVAEGLAYIWDGSAWPAQSEGIPFQGPKGDQGRGIDTIEIVGDSLVFTMSDSPTTETVAVPAITAANNAATAAAASATAAAGSAGTAADAATAAAAARDTATTKATDAAASATAAAGSSTAAATAKTAAESAAGTATTKAADATASASAAGTAKTAAESAQTAAATSATAAAGSATNAGTSATAAGNSAAAAATSQTASADSAANSAASASDSQYWAEQAAESVGSGIPNATTTTKGGVQLSNTTGEVGGTWDHMVVNGWNSKADLVGGKIPQSQLPQVAIMDVRSVASTAARLALTDVQTGDIAIQTGNPGRGTYILSGSDPSSASDWTLMVVDMSVTSVNGYTGIVVLSKSDVGLANVDNTSDSNKPVSTATQTALNGKVGTARTVSAGTGLTGGGDLTADRSIALSAATQTSLGKADSAVQPTRAVSGGTGLTGGGDLSADRTLSLSAATQASLGKADSAIQQAALDSAIGNAQLIAINAQTVTAYTLDLSDQNKAVECANASAITVTVPPNSAKAFPIGSVIEVVQTGAGQVTIAQGSGVTVSSRSGLKLAGQWAVAVLRKRSTDGWILAGDTTT
ncbi:hypothetical protein HH308_06300 [Gordonia sp. TBRC 11910]|uniref:Minor tail protein n=1 Tax=Gordonia asplenii TaxID=2725283 RepID=A0A848KWI7_9ACTN|nr:hypothetical protein [Gordonia asplenii]NMO00823.1 hypothetical protein [Gordonia asplenii]